MQDIKDALQKEAEDWLGPDDTFGDWCRHVMIEPSDELLAAFQAVDIEDDEEYEDAMDPLIYEAYQEHKKD